MLFPSNASPLTPPVRGGVLRHGPIVALANAAIAGLMATINGGHFGHLLVYSECIGLSIWGLIEFGSRLLPAQPSGWPGGWGGIAVVAGSCALGYGIGVTVGDAIFGYTSWANYFRSPVLLMRDFGPTVVFCTVVVAAFYAHGQVRAQRARAAAAAHEATLARLSLLQSQLEPHMLFNTLANLRALMAADPSRAQDMLDHLIAFLRATLAASRLAEHPLADEFARIEDYLALMRVRMGERLRAGVALPPELAAIAVPPLLLQPLVENAIKHGLEPQRGPGELRVDAALDGATLVLTVADSGRGLDAAAAARAREPADAGGGFGLTQIRERLQTLHGDAASLTLAPRAEGGTRAEIRVPLPARKPTA
ncbi:sensor histidine kinase [Scleromatobacter humisilvae]|uniref:histidine kinase n=1 Tax=Scleromatobacter humisilvae TaxID=2897159 RepID=A0A9X2C038_9BURK|nr:histidine kinase [Scleromatobacter humisilvae]MCK9684304.1 histidine kinase [Scleromatobacter humisilvae]